MPGKITTEQVDAILDALGDLGVNILDDTVKPDYSGRAMYGKTCVAIVLDGDDGDLLKLGMAMQRALGDDADTAEKMANAMRSDNLGRWMVYYFPGWTIDQAEEADETEDAPGS